MDSPWSTLPTGRYTRVLSLVTGSLKLECKLDNIDLESDNFPKYEAISYVWGSKDDTTLLSCNGVDISIPRSLARALTVIWRYRPTMSIWCDAVSIDQRSQDEKARQIMMMDIIFQKAAVVNVWLDVELVHDTLFWYLMLWHMSRKVPPNSVDDRDDPLGVLCCGQSASELKLYKNLDDDVSRRIESTNVTLDISMNADNFEAISVSDSSNVESYDLVEGYQETQCTIWSDSTAQRFIIDSLIRICGSAWFTRVWTVQEILLAQSSLIWIGNSAVRWHELRSLMVDMDVWFEDDDEFQKCHPGLDNFMQLPDRSAYVLGENNPAALRIAMFRRATDPHDKFFAVQGLLSSSMRCEVDYTTPLASVYAYGTRLILSVEGQVTGLYRIFQRAGLSSRCHRKHALGKLWTCAVDSEEKSSAKKLWFPSWVPNYACAVCMHASNMNIALHGRDWLPNLKRSDYRLSPDCTDKQLIIRGSFIGILGKAKQSETASGYARCEFVFHNMPACVRKNRQLRTYSRRYKHLITDQLSEMRNLLQLHGTGDCVCLKTQQQFMRLIAALTGDHYYPVPHGSRARPDMNTSRALRKLAFFAGAGVDGSYSSSRRSLSAARTGDWVFELGESASSLPSILILRDVNETDTTQNTGFHNQISKFQLVESEEDGVSSELSFRDVPHVHPIGDAGWTEVKRCPLEMSGAHVTCAITLV